MRRSAGVCFWMAMMCLAAGTRCLGAPDPRPIPADPEKSAVSIPAEGAVVPAPEPPSADTDAEEVAADGTAPNWLSELDLIADLLIDEKPLEAKDRAEQLLEEEGLPEYVASRARALRDKAEAKLAESPQAGSEPRPRIEIPAKDQSREPNEKTTPASKEQSFKVRVAAIGGGFGQGVTGLLRISEQGLSFVPQGNSREDWAIRWPNLADAKSDTGLWDAPYPLVLIEHGGRKHYVARLDEKGSYLPGAPLLSAIAKGRRK